MKALITCTTALALSVAVYMYSLNEKAGFQEQVYKYMLEKCGPNGSMMVMFALDGSDIAAGACHEGEGIMQFYKESNGDLKVEKRGVK